MISTESSHRIKFRRLKNVQNKREETARNQTAKFCAFDFQCGKVIRSPH